MWEFGQVLNHAGEAHACPSVGQSDRAGPKGSTVELMTAALSLFCDGPGKSVRQLPGDGSAEKLRRRCSAPHKAKSRNFFILDRVIAGRRRAAPSLAQR